MEVFNFNESEQLLMDSVSYSTPEKPVYKRNDYAALAEVMNSTVALVNRGEYEKASYDLSQYEGVQFTRDSLLKSLKDKKVSEDVIDRVMARPIANWNEAEIATAYLTHLKETEEQVANQFTTGSMIGAGLSMAIFDPTDFLLVSPILSAANKIKKATTLATKVGAVAQSAATGSAVGTAAMLTYETSTGVYNEGSMVNAALLGAALGGSLGLVLDKAPLQKGLTKELDGEGKVLSAEEAKVEKIRLANEKVSEIDSVIAEASVLVKEQKGVQKELTASEKLDVKKAKVDASLQKSQLETSVQTIKTLSEESTATAKTARDSLDSIINSKTKLEETILKTEKKTSVFKKLQEDIATLAKSATPIKGQITKLNNTIKSLQAKPITKEITAKLNSLEKQVGKLTKELNVTNTKMALAETKLNKFVEDPTISLKSLEEQRQLLLTSEQKAQELSTAKTTEADANLLKVKEANKQLRDFRLREAAKEAERQSVGTKDLQAKLAKYNADLSPQGLQKLAADRLTLTDDINKLLNDDDLSVSSLTQLKKVQENYVSKLNKELEEINNAKDFKQKPWYKKLPTWLVISPIEKLLNSSNDLVSGFASKLHSGTVHHGLIQNKTAWTIRQNLDTSLDYTHKALRYNFVQAVKEGYTGKIEDFEREVTVEYLRGNSKIQEEVYTQMDGALDEAARLEIIKQRQASVQRSTFSGNKWVTKSVEDYARYYEKMDSIGKNLDIGAFKFTSAKGYLNRVYSESKIKAFGTPQDAIEQLTDAQIKFARATNGVVTDAVIAEFEALATKAVEATLSRKGIREALVRPLGTPQRSSTSALQARTIQVFDEDLIPFLDDSISMTSSLYGLRMHGNFALKEAIGVHNNDEIEKLFKSLEATPKELDNLRVVVETIKGIREISKNPYDPTTRAIKALSSYSSIMKSAAFGVNTVTEISALAKEFGWSKSIDKLIGTPSEIYRIYRYGTPSEKNTIEMMISYGDAHFGIKASRLESENILDSVGLQNKLDHAVRMSSIFGGLLPITDMLKMASASLTVDFMAGLSVARKISKTDEMRLNDIGFTIEDLAQVKQVLQVDSNGRIGNTNRASWGALDEKITNAVITMVERTILDPNGITLPKFMTNMNEGQIVPRLLMKFMRFPFESYERLLLRGVQEADAKQLTAFAGNIAMWTGILAMKDALKDPEKQKYSSADGFNSLMIDSFLYGSATALPVALTEMGYGYATGQSLTGDYAFRMGGAPISDLVSAQKGEFRYSVPFTSFNIGDAVGEVLNDLNFLQMANED